MNSGETGGSGRPPDLRLACFFPFFQPYIISGFMLSLSVHCSLFVVNCFFVFVSFSGATW